MNNKIKTYELFSFLKIYCKCGCKNIIILNKNKIRLYEIHGYPKFIHGHNTRIYGYKEKVLVPNKKQKVYGDFSYTIKCFCSCPCHQEIKIENKNYLRYENRGYPKWIVGHQGKGKHPSEQAKLKQSESHMGSKNVRFGITSPMKGTKASEATKEKCRKASLGSKNAMFGVTPSPLCNKHYGSYYYTPLQGYKFLRSTWEVAYAEYLDRNNILWYYESITFPLSEGMTYTPDFFLSETNEYIEVKGNINDIIKINKFKEDYSYHLKVLFYEDLLNLGINLKYYKKNKTKKYKNNEEDIMYENCLGKLFE